MKEQLIEALPIRGFFNLSDVQRFMANVKESERKFWRGTPCWEWEGGKCGSFGGDVKYGRFFWKRPDPKKRGLCLRVMAHRFAYFLFHGWLSEQDEVHHKCHNTLCVNPRHIKKSKIEQHREEHRQEAPIPF